MDHSFGFHVFQVERERERQGSDDEDDESKYTELKRREDEKIRLEGLKMAPKKEIQKIEESGVFKKPVDPSKKSGKLDQSGEKRKPSALEEIMREEEERKKKMVCSKCNVMRDR